MSRIESRGAGPMRSMTVLSLSGAMLIALALVIMPATSAMAKTGVVYNSIPNPLPGNIPSVGAESSAFNEFGNQIRLAGTSARIAAVVVTMSDFACQSGHWYNNTCFTTPGSTFFEPMALNIYHAPATGSAVPGSLIATASQTFAIPYRPSDDNVNCPSTDGTGRWFDGVNCYHGLATNITFRFASVRVPRNIVFGIAYDTTHYGYTPYTEGAPCFSTPTGCPYDSLNIGLSQDPTNLSVGSDPNPGTIFQFSSIGSQYCDGGTAGTNVFRLDSPTSACWFVSGSSGPSYIPAVQFQRG